MMVRATIRLCVNYPQIPVFQDEEGVPVELRHLPEYKELLELKRLRKQKIHELQSESSITQHIGYKVQDARSQL